MKNYIFSYEKAKKILVYMVPVLIAVFSIFVVADFISSDAFTAKTVKIIDESRENVLKLTASSTAVSVGITALPGDLGTPIADSVAELSIGFLIVLCALYLEKFFLLIVGFISYKIIMPVACLIHIFSSIRKNAELRKLAYKLAFFAIILSIFIPIGTRLSGMIDDKYGEYIAETIEAAENTADQLKDGLGQKDEDAQTDDSASNGLGKVLDNIQNAGESIATGTTEYMRYLEKLISRYIEAIAIMVVTSCIIPIIVLMIFLGISKMLFYSTNTTIYGDDKKK